ncbi:MAG TPA: hypothetical protein VNU22_03275 [Candidatus Acidoferrum sp.]|jgi:uncharacterized membrane protein|nr:hypothetical protein [Candidatus Acidoferrum sp.]
MLIADTAFVTGLQSHSASLELDCPAEDAFALLCAVEKWPVWLSFLRSARRQSSQSELNLGSEVVIRSCLPGDEEQLFEVDAFIANYRLSLVGAFSLRRRLDFRIERRTSCSKLHVLLAYPAYHGKLGGLLDRWQRGRRFSSALDDSLVHFKGLVEYKRDAPVLADF